jgi:hypothetical protein
MIIFGGDRMMLPVLLRTNAERAAVQAILKNPDGYLFAYSVLLEFCRSPNIQWYSLKYGGHH